MELLNIKTELLAEHSKSQTKKIADYIGANEILFHELMQIFIHSDYRLNQRAVWVVRECALKYPFLINPYFKEILEKLKEPNIHDAIKRNTVRILEEIELPEEFLGEIYESCYGFLIGKEAIAIQAFSMTVCFRISEKIPELKEELKLTIEDLLMKNFGGSAGINHRGKQILAKLKKKK